MAPSSLLEPAISFISGLINRDLHGPTIQSNDPNASQGGPNNGNSKSQNISYDVINSLQRRDMNRILSTRRLFKSKKELMFFILKHLTGLIIVTYVLQHYTLSHPFLLADNRSVTIIIVSCDCLTHSLTHSLTHTLTHTLTDSSGVLSFSFLDVIEILSIISCCCFCRHYSFYLWSRILSKPNIR